MAMLLDFLAGSWKQGWGLGWGGGTKGGATNAGVEKSCGESNLQMAVEWSWMELASECLPWGQLRTQSPRHSFSHKVSKSPRSQAQLAGFTDRPTEEAGGLRAGCTGS